MAEATTASEAVTTSDKFDIKIVHDAFHESLEGEDDVRLQNYIDSYKELYKFLTLMGTVFGFVASDVKSKLDILIEFLSKAEAENFSTVKTMIEYEKSQELLTKKDYVSGCRTLLRLHRGLDFIQVFLKRLSELQNFEKTATVCQESYDQTLAQFHPWLIKKGARVAMAMALPARDQLLKRVCGTEQEIQRATSILPKMLEVTRDVYDRIENLYTVNDLHSLP